MKEIILTFLVALVIGAAINGFSGAGSNAVNPTEPPAAQAASPGAASAQGLVGDATDSSWDTDVLQSQQPVLVDFYAEWCGPCKRMAPIVEKLAGEYGGKVKFFRVDIDRNPSVTARYNVQSIPTFVMFQGGQRGESFTGMVPETALKQVLDKTL